MSRYESSRYGDGGRYDDRRGGGRRDFRDGRRGERFGGGRPYDDRRRGGNDASGGGAEHLARIHGTEEDRVNCPFYFKIGACRHGDRCSRLHNKPAFSQTVLIKHMYQNPLSQIIAQSGDASMLDETKVNEEFEDFFEEVFEELLNFGTLEELNVCDNLGDHLVGNVYAKFEDEEHAAAAQKALYGRFYAGRPLICEFSPVTDFREARCRQFDEGTCTRGGYCNFMHIKNPSRELLRDLIRESRRKAKASKRSRSRSDSRSRSKRRSRSPTRRRGRSRSRSNSRSSSPRRKSSRYSRSRSRSSKRKRRSRSRSPRDKKDRSPSKSPTKDSKNKED